MLRWRTGLALFLAMAFGFVQGALAQSSSSAPVQFPIAQTQGGTSVSPLQLPHWRACLAAEEAQTQNCVIDVVGDSTIEGIYGSTYNNVYTQNLTYWLAAYLNSYTSDNVYANNNGFCGGSASNRLAADSRISNLYGWSYNSTATLGGYLPQSGATNATLTYTPGGVNPYDTFVLTYYYASGVSGGATIQATGGPVVTVPTPGSTGVYTVTATAGSASNTNSLNLTTTGVNFFPLCLDAYNSNQSSIQISNDGWSGAQSYNIAAGTTGNPVYYPFLELLSRKAPLVILEGGVINDWLNSVATATTQANFASMVSQLLANGQDVILVTGIPNNTNTAQEAADVQAMNQVAKQYNVPIFDWNSRWVNEATSNALGYYYTDGVHGVPPGYADAAWALEGMLLHH